MDLNVAVTTGGTSEPIDDVRSVTNFSTGRFGIGIAEQFAAAGADVTVLGSREASAHLRRPGISWVPFSSSVSLAAALSGLDTPDVVFHLAAVADYAPVPATGKLSSSADEMVVTMRRNPKLIDGFRDSFGPDAFLVGAKLTSGAPAGETFSRAVELLERARLDLVIANDLAECRNGMHPCWLIAADGVPVRIEGTRAEVAARIVSVVAERAAR